MPPKKSIALLESALESVIEHVEKSPEFLPFPLRTARIDYLPAELVRPDPVQARRILPEGIHFSFHAGQLTPVQALHELVRAAQLAARQNGRPFTNVLDLLADLDSEEDRDGIKYTPEELLVRDLVSLAATLRDDGQVNPLTVLDVSQGVTRMFRIETGERRYWASWLLREFLPGYTGDGTIPCVMIPNTQVSAFRQARENTSREGLSAIAMARQAALLLMAVHSIPKPDEAVTNDFYRQALDLDLRDKREYTDAILTAMGGISRSQFSRIKSLLVLSDDAMELADLHQVDESRLRYVTKLPVEDQGEMVKQIIQFRLTRTQVQQMCEHPDEQVEKSAESDVSKSLVQLAKLTRSSSTLNPEAFAKILIEQEKDVHLAYARIQSLKGLLEETEAQLMEK